MSVKIFMQIPPFIGKLSTVIQNSEYLFNTLAYILFLFPTFAPSLPEPY